MRIRQIDPRAGQEVTLRHPVNSYTLPADLIAGTKAKYIRYDYGQVIVEQNGKTWRMPMQCIEYEYRYEVGSRWYPKDHPLVMKERHRLQALHASLKAEQTDQVLTCANV